MNTFTLGLIVIAYLLSLAYLGFLGYKKTTSASDYLVGGRQMNPIVMALSYGATFISASAIVGFGGVAAAFGMGIQWLCFLNMFVGVIIAFIFFGLRTRRMGVKLNVSTFPQLLGRYYRSRSIQVFIAAIIFLGMPLYAAVVMKGGAVFIEQIFQIEFNISLLIFTLVIAAYVIAGGMKGVMYTDALQGVIMFVCMLFLLFSLYQVLGMNFTEANQALTDIAPLVPEKFKAMGHQGWTAMPVTGSPQWYTLVTSLILGVGIGCLAQPQLVVRFMTVESSKQLNRGVLIGCVFLIITVGAIYHAGALSNLYFLKTEGAVATDVVKDMDKIIPYFIKKAMPDWFSALFMLCILSASMSTLSSQFHTMGAAAGSDIYGTYKPRSRNKLTNVIRLGVLVSILVSYVICYMLPNDIIARGTAIFMGICAAAFLPAYFSALYWKGATRQGALASLWAGSLASVFALVFLHEKESAAMGICRALFGRDVLIEAYPFPVIDPILFALPLSVLALVVVSLLTKRL
ncbi:sodium:solute symporter family protein [Bacteroides sp.]|uniref:sodium:solute symporter family protein n=1 Tax=Bacteroides sp. TaxID=29523 RepID=UPI001B71F4B7|nr:sodium:solute symporter family protein [Bacteroides sp.]MBP6064640.1 sodium:solute symporter family protein [Bacteroides sp.]MBP6067114.1 sodium:solute symporter family protein [Bacteroides sp.]MBP6935865.1 sodium:solute symporter family protein [Bacteroides sp.]MBP8622753.1 sodium:solute symporter family protein [Bacteroides sp.]MBP9585480.1 sodium:solute symporter family protein [Bacteroides sp.]